MIFLDAEHFSEKGGWVLDSQSYPQMGSAYLLAHGLGRCVEDAVEHFSVEGGGSYHLWVRTRDWTAPWGRTEAPGRFQVAVNGTYAGVVFGTEGAGWHWQYGGSVVLLDGDNELRLHDLTGFDGRCDAVCFTSEAEAPANGREALKEIRAVGKQRIHAGHYDLLVAGGGIAGCCAAVTAARLGCKVALVQNRPVLGGNNSSEVRVGLSGLICQEPFPKLGGLMDELGGVGHWTAYEARMNPDTERSRHILEELERHPEKIIHNAGPASNYEDGKKLDLVLGAGVDLFLSTQLDKVEKNGDKIVGVSAKRLSDGARIDFTADMFVDCTGDADLGFLAGADWKSGREPQSETGEPRAPQVPDNMTMGTSVQWYSEESSHEETFPDCPWALRFTDGNCIHEKRGDWQWEAGIGHDHVSEIETIRDHALRAVFGNWSFLKNGSSRRDEYRNSRLEWVAYIGGKRESRRLLGDIVLKEQDILGAVPYDDASFTTTWPVDLHFPVPIEGLDGESFLADCDNPSIEPYPVPYRCLYSRNVSNLFMAGRNISVTHVALGTVRVMRTCGMMGEVVGMAASLCRKHGVSPREIYEGHLDELRDLMAKGIAIKTL